MRVNYAPEGSDVQSWDFVPGRIRESRGEMMERRYAKLIGEKSASFEMFRMGVLQGQSSARRVLLWHLLSLEHPTIKQEDVDPFKGELEVEASKSELIEMRAVLEHVGGVDDIQREIMLAQMDAQIKAAPDDDGGKAPSKISAESTG